MLANPTSGARRKLFRPDFIVKSVINIDFSLLQSQGIKAVLIDLDGTVVARGKFDVDKKITDYLKKQSLDIYIATNRPKGRDLKNLKQSLNASDAIHPVGVYMKPFPKYFKQAASIHKFNSPEVAMIGDRYIQDIFGANLAGLTTILVRKLGNPKGYIDIGLSKLEKRHTNKLAAQYVRAIRTK